MKGRYGPALLHIIENTTQDPIERCTLMRRFVKNPQYAGETQLKRTESAMLYLNADPLVDVNNGQVGYQIGLLVTNTVFYEQVGDYHERHLIRADLPEAVLLGAVGRKLGDIASGIDKMKGIWDAEAVITGVETIKGASHLAIAVPSWPIDTYLGESVSD